MEVLQQAYKLALENNYEETQRWKKYQEDHQNALLNMQTFIKKVEVEIMVPIGSKALVPGHLYHTNEILVSHYGGLFSKCSSSQAQDVCKYRLKLAKERLEALEKERAMYQNKADIPFTDGIIPREDQQDIVEEYDEEKEKLWREEHKKNVRAQKRKEREHNEENKKSDEDIFKHLEDLEIMEEIYNELDELDVDDDTLQKILSGEISLPSENKRVSHYSENTDNVIIGIKANNQHLTNKNEITDKDEKTDTYNNLNISNREECYTYPFTNNNTIINNNDFVINQEESDSSSDEDIPAEIRDIEKEASTLNKQQKLKFLKKKLKEISEAIVLIRLATVADIDLKLNKEEVRDFLIDYIEMVKDDNDDEEQIQTSFNESNPITTTQETNIVVKKKKRIRFSNEDQIRIIDKNASVSAPSKSHVSIIKDNMYCTEKDIPSDIPFVDKKLKILEKVEKNCNLVAEKQSQNDFDLIGKILNANKTEEYFKITFQHSDKLFEYPNYENENLEESAVVERIGSPADIYKVFNSYFPEHLQKKLFEKPTVANNNEIPLNTLNDKIQTTNLIMDNTAATEFPKSGIEKLSGTKSILKNKEAVTKETRLEVEVKEKEVKGTKKNKKRAEQQKIEDFGTILGDIVEKKSGENPQPTEPDPLPKGKFVDAHAPKKRISRFKKLRDGNTI